MAGKRCIIAMFPALRRRWLPIVPAVLALGLMGFLILRPSASSPAASGERLMENAKGLPDYRVTLRLDADKGTLSVTETICFRNETGDALSDLVLRTWVNAFRQEETSPAALEELYDACYPEGFSPGEVQVHDVQWNGEWAEWAYANEDQTALRVQIPTLPAGEEGTLTFRCVMLIPCCAYRTGRVDGAFALGNCLPLLSRYEDGAWRTDGYSPIGDPFVSDCANFHVTAYLPAGYTPAASCALKQDADGAWRGDMYAARDFALCAAPDYARAEGRAGDVTVLSFAKTQEEARRALDFAQRALTVYADLYGPCPYPTVTLCRVSFPFGGMEYPGLCMLGEGGYAESKADSLELTVAHEIAHQWFYALVGSDQMNDPWQDEALCEYAMLRYVRARYGQSSFETLKYYRVDAPMQDKLPGTLTPGSPIDYFGSLNDYACVVYGRGAALVLALDELLPQGVDAFLRAYADAFAFQFVSWRQFEDFLNGYAGMDLHPLLLDYLDTVMD